MQFTDAFGSCYGVYSNLCPPASGTQRIKQVGAQALQRKPLLLDGASVDVCTRMIGPRSVATSMEAKCLAAEQDQRCRRERCRRCRLVAGGVHISHLPARGVGGTRSERAEVLSVEAAVPRQTARRQSARPARTRRGKKAAVTYPLRALAYGREARLRL